MLSGNKLRQVWKKKRKTFYCATQERNREADVQDCFGFKNVCLVYRTKSDTRSEQVSGCQQRQTKQDFGCLALLIYYSAVTQQYRAREGRKQSRERTFESKWTSSSEAVIESIFMRLNGNKLERRDERCRYMWRYRGRCAEKQALLINLCLVLPVYQQGGQQTGLRK